MNIQLVLEERLVDLKKQLLGASIPLSSTEASLMEPCEVRVSFVTSRPSLSSPFRTLSQIIPQPIHARGHRVSITSLMVYGVFDASKDVHLIRYSFWAKT